MQSLSNDSIDEKVRGSISTQGYGGKPQINGVQIVDLKKFISEDGSFEELIRLNEDGTIQAFPEFKLAQVNRSMLLSRAIKAWHLHYRQDDIWYVLPEAHMIVGLWDLRKDSSTCDVTMRVVLGGGASKLVFIPRGVAHGVMNVGSKAGTIIYLMNQHFNPQDPDERRLAWDAAGKDFWEAKKE